MEPITIRSAGRIIQFTNKEITVDGTSYPYGRIHQLWHIPQRSAYAFRCDEQMVAFPYEQKDAPLLQALMERIGQALNLTVEEYRQPNPAEASGGAGTSPLAEGETGSGEGSNPETEADTEDENGAYEETGSENSSGAESGDDAAVRPAGGPLRDRRFLIEMAAGILLILAGIAGFFLHG